MSKLCHLTLFAGLWFAGVSENANAWGQNGHRITGEIAERNLTPEAKASVRKILGEETLAEISTWGDEIRSDPTWDFVQPWHYISIDDDESWDDFERDDDGDILMILEKLEAFLRDLDAETLELSAKVGSKSSKSSLKARQKKVIGKRDALALYVHFIGDLHQPLHVGRRDDKGGNRILVEFFDEELSLHRIWDENLIDSLKLSFTELTSLLDRREIREAVFKNPGDHLDWAKESKEIRPKIYDFGAQRSGYYLNIKEAPRLSYDYRHKVIPIVKDRLAKGGFRLAAKLNEIFGGDDPTE